MPGHFNCFLRLSLCRIGEMVRATEIKFKARRLSQMSNICCSYTIMMVVLHDSKGNVKSDIYLFQINLRYASISRRSLKLNIRLAGYFVAKVSPLLILKYHYFSVVLMLDTFGMYAWVNSNSTYYFSGSSKIYRVYYSSHFKEGMFKPRAVKHPIEKRVRLRTSFFFGYSTSRGL